MQWTRLWSIFVNKLRLLGRPRHFRKIRTARLVQQQIIKIAGQEFGYAKALTYLRKIDPLVFEELILNCIEQQNYHVRRNKKYTGDNGLDGAVHTKAGLVIIQCKRYAQYINPKDVADFCELIQASKHAGGLFVHTGRTGPTARTIRNESQKLHILSGDKLINLVLGIYKIKKILEVDV